MLSHKGTQPFLQHLGVDLGGADIRVSQQHLQAAQIRPPLQKVRSKGMTQHMRADPGGIQARRQRYLFQNQAQALARDMQTVAMDELPYIPLGSYKSMTALRANLTGRVAGLALYWGIRRS